jgi:hypothetical protein
MVNNQEFVISKIKHILTNISSDTKSTRKLLTFGIMKKPKTLWRWWAKSLGEKASKCDKESDKIAIIRTIIFATYLITNCFIVAGVIRQWDRKTVVEVYVDNAGIPSYTTPSERKVNKPFEFE